ncbi:MAG: DNA-3-methyladenine glycosylase I [Candidatus Dormibacteria bacterium]
MSDPGVVVGDDGLARCPWATSPGEYRLYHDREWGRPVAQDDRVFEKLCLEGFQSGLSWLTILRKRDGFRRAFSQFDPATVAAFGDQDVDRLLSDAAIVRHRGKIRATIANARATLALREQGVSLAAMCWTFAPGPTPAPRAVGDLPSRTAASEALSVTLKRHGFQFVGAITVYSAMQSLGLVNDHLAGCSLRPEIESERACFKVPSQMTFAAATSS